MRNGKDNPDNEGLGLRIPVLLPTGRDAELVSGMLERAGMPCAVCASAEEMLDRFRFECGPFVAGAEALSGNALNRLLDVLEAQPEWSDLPGVVLTGHATDPALQGLLNERRGISLIRRPVRKAVLLNIMKSAFEDRQRQYQVRNLLNDLIQTNEKLRSRTDLMQKVALELTRAEDEERRRIARLLHDGLQQMLIAAKLHSEWLSKNVTDTAANRAEKVFVILGDAVKASRELSHELSPALFSRNSLGVILKQIGTKMADDYGFRIETKLDTDTEEIDENIKSFVCRSVRELFANCAKYADANLATLELSNRKNRLVITMTDDGVGFDPNKLAIYGGNEGGLGLFGIQERISSLGGSFEIHSRPNAGSRFVFDIPLKLENEAEFEAVAKSSDVETVVKAAEKTVGENGKLKPVTVMIADDHAMMRQGLASLLEQDENISVVAEVSDGLQALELAQTLRPDVILMDFFLPLSDGVETTRKIKEKTPGVAVIGISTQEEIRESMLNAGAHAFLKKDVEIGELIDAIGQCVKSDS